MLPLVIWVSECVALGIAPVMYENTLYKGDISGAAMRVAAELSVTKQSLQIVHGDYLHLSLI